MMFVLVVVIEEVGVAAVVKCLRGKRVTTVGGINKNETKLIHTRPALDTD